MKNDDAAFARALAAILAQDVVAQIEQHGGEDAWRDAVDVLTDAQRLGSIDWRSEPDELQAALDPLLQRHAVALDWSFLDALERAGDWQAIKNENLLPRVAQELTKHNLVLAHIDEGTDAYVFAVCTPQEWAAIAGLRGGHLKVGRFD